MTDIMMKEKVKMTSQKNIDDLIIRAKNTKSNMGNAFRHAIDKEVKDVHVAYVAALMHILRVMYDEAIKGQTQEELVTIKEITDAVFVLAKDRFDAWDAKAASASGLEKILTEFLNELRNKKNGGLN